MQNRVKVVSIRQAKCNLCHEWIVLPKCTPRSLYACQNCLLRYQQPTIIHDDQGQPHILNITPAKSSFPPPHLFNDPTIKKVTFSQIDSFSRQVSEIQLMKSGVSTNNQDSRIESRNTHDSMMLNNRSQQGLIECSSIEKLSRNRSQILNHIKSNVEDNKISQWEQSYRTSAKNKKVEGYEFYYDSNEIERYKYHQSATRSFGTELEIPLNFNQDELYLHLKGNRKSSATNSNRSNYSQDHVYSILRLKEDCLKLKIDSYLETRYQSSSFQRILASNIKEAYDMTNIQPKMIELVSFNVSSIDLLCYLNLFEMESLNTLKLVNLGLKDQHMKDLIDWVGIMKVERLVLTCNRLTDNCMHNFTGKALPYLKQLYLGRNRINKYRMKENIVELRSKFILYL